MASKRTDPKPKVVSDDVTVRDSKKQQMSRPERFSLQDNPEDRDSVHHQESVHSSPRQQMDFQQMMQQMMAPFEKQMAQRDERSEKQMA